MNRLSLPAGWILTKAMRVIPSTDLDFVARELKKTVVLIEVTLLIGMEFYATNATTFRMTKRFPDIEGKMPQVEVYPCMSGR